MANSEFRMIMGRPLVCQCLLRLRSLLERERTSTNMICITNATFTAWSDLRAGARTSGIRRAPVSGFRSVERQKEIFRQKLTRGLTIPEILTVNAAPGYSQHHTGCALDIADETASSQPLEEDFELTSSFAWLVKHGSKFGFSLEYPRSNRYGFIYEPWHWAFIDVEDYKLKRYTFVLSRLLQRTAEDFVGHSKALSATGKQFDLDDDSAYSAVQPSRADLATCPRSLFHLPSRMRRAAFTLWLSRIQKSSP